MHAAIQAVLLSIAIIVGYFLWMVIKGGTFSEMCERAYFTIFGVIMSYFIFGGGL
jgi:hypothetical protein